MIFFLEEEIAEGFEVFKAWFETEAIPQIEAAGGACLVCGVDAENENILHLVMETPSMDVVEVWLKNNCVLCKLVYNAREWKTQPLST